MWSTSAQLQPPWACRWPVSIDKSLFAVNFVLGVCIDMQVAKHLRLWRRSFSGQQTMVKGIKASLFLKDSTSLKQYTAAELINLPERGVVNAWMRQSVLELSLHCGLSAMCVLHGWLC